MAHFLIYLCICDPEDGDAAVIFFDDCNHRFTLGTQICTPFVIIIGLNYRKAFLISSVIRVDYGTITPRTFADGDFSADFSQFSLLLFQSCGLGAFGRGLPFSSLLIGVAFK